MRALNPLEKNEHPVATAVAMISAIKQHPGDLDAALLKALQTQDNTKTFSAVAQNTSVLPYLRKRHTCVCWKTEDNQCFASIADPHGAVQYVLIDILNGPGCETAFPDMDFPSQYEQYANSDATYIYVIDEEEQAAPEPVQKKTKTKKTVKKEKEEQDETK